MNEAKKSKYRQPKYMAVNKGNKDSESTAWNNKKKWKVNTSVLLTWIAVIALTVIFWFLLIKLF